MSKCPFSRFKDILGIPMEGIHSYRFLNTAIVDYSMSIILAFVIAYYTDIPLVLTTIGVFILGILLHMLFGVDTSTIKYLGLTCK